MTILLDDWDGMAPPGVDADGVVREYPVTEVGLLQLLEGINRATQDEEAAKAASAAAHNSKLSILKGNRDSCLVKLTRLRDGDYLPFEDQPLPTPVDGSVVLEDEGGQPLLVRDIAEAEQDEALANLDSEEAADG